MAFSLLDHKGQGFVTMTDLTQLVQQLSVAMSLLSLLLFYFAVVG